MVSLHVTALFLSSRCLQKTGSNGRCACKEDTVSHFYWPFTDQAYVVHIIYIWLLGLQNIHWPTSCAMWRRPENDITWHM